jgi:hypothetical protein
MLVAISGDVRARRFYGNENGGVIDWAFTNEEKVFRQTTQHCAKYGRTAKITNIKAISGGHVFFDCI